MKPKWLPTNLGAEPKKLAILAALVVVLVAVYWINRTPEPDPLPAARPVVAPPPIQTLPSPGPRTRPSSQPILQRRAAAGNTNGRGTIDDFRPSVKLPEGSDVSQIDPSLHVELLAKVRATDAAVGGRSLFEFSQPPAPPPPAVKPIVPGPAKPSDEVKPPPIVAVEPPKPPPVPPITLKYYGFAGTPQSGKRQAFFLDGDDIFVAGENELVRSRYKIVRIGVNSAVVEDTTNKNQQTLPLVEELGG